MQPAYHPGLKNIRQPTHLVAIKGRGRVQGMLHKVQARWRGRGLPEGGGVLWQSRARCAEASSPASKLGRLQQDSQLHKLKPMASKRHVEGENVWIRCQVCPCRPGCVTEGL